MTRIYFILNTFNSPKTHPEVHRITLLKGWKPRLMRNRFQKRLNAKIILKV
jgi:hypothetical protein